MKLFYILVGFDIFVLKLVKIFMIRVMLKLYIAHIIYSAKPHKDLYTHTHVEFHVCWTRSWHVHILVCFRHVRTVAWLHRLCFHGSFYPGQRSPLLQYGTVLLQYLFEEDGQTSPQNCLNGSRTMLLPPM